MNGKNKGILHKIKSIRLTVLLPFVLLISAAVLILSIISVAQINDTQTEISIEYTKQLVDMVNNDIDSYVSTMENLAQLVLNDASVTSYMNTKNTDVATARYEDAISKQFSLLKDTRDDIYNIGVIGRDGRYFINSKDTQINPYSDYKSMGWYTKALNGQEGEITSSHVQNVVRYEYPWVVTLSKGIRNPLNDGIGGVLFIDLNYSSISELCDNISLGSKGYVFVLDEDSSVVYHPKQQLLYSNILDEQIDQIIDTQKGDAKTFLSRDGKKLYTVTRSQKTGWFVVGVTYMDELLLKSKQTQKVFVLLAILVLAIATAISVYISAAITSPITMLRSTMAEVEEGNLEAQMPEPNASNEIRDLVASFNSMVIRIKNLIKKNKEDEKAKRKSELRALQAQINPHFLYNTLDSIIWMSESGENTEVVKMTSALSKLLRKSISNQKEIVTVEEEVEYVSEYLKIQQMRYRDKLSYEINVEPEVLHHSIMKLVLQPLVENAIYHGIKEKEGMGRILITGVREDDVIRLQVYDDGLGMDEESLAAVLSGKKQGSAGRVGVHNVNSRLKLHYGEEYGLTYFSKQNVGTTVTITIPVDARERRDHEVD